jgi:type IX secretion system PorP/SprF family membrane protein
MKKITTLFTVLILVMNLDAQQIPMFSEIYFMRLLYNPALTGYNGSTNLYGFYRNQWVNLPGHPVTVGAVGDVSLWQDRCAAGFDVFSDNTDIIHRFHADLYYAQKIRLAKDHTLSLGVTLGIVQTYIDFANAVVNDPNDPNLLLNGKSGLAFNMNVGLAYQWKKLTVGFSVPQVLNTYTPIATQENYATYNMLRAYIGNVSYEISINHEKWNIEPMVQVKKASVGPWQVDASIMANYNRIAYLGAGYSLDYGVAVMAAVRISQIVTLGYSYDFPIMNGGVNYSQTRGTHEVILGISFTKFMKKKSAAESEKAPVYARQSQVDSVAAKQDSLQKQVDSIQLVADSLQKSNNTLQNQQQEQQKIMKDIQQHVDSFDNIAKEYKKTISENPAKDFPNQINKETTASKGDVFRLNKVNFENNSSYLTKGSYGELDKVADFLKNNPTMSVRINGHTDYKASDEYNQWLSDRRAKRVYDYLLEKGVPVDKMTYIGFGKRMPIADNNTEEGRAKNRRVEIEVLKKE